jgi:hypothetical protein
MTAQIPEKLLMNGETLTLCSEPLDDYFTSHGEPGFAVNCTALWRGYVGTWEIRDARLFLVGIEAEYPDGSSVSLAKLFQGETERIFARWFTGTLRCPRGGELEYVHMGYQCNKYPLVSKEKAPKYNLAAVDGYWVMTHSSTEDKRKQLVDIAAGLKVGLTVDVVPPNGR